MSQPPSRYAPGALLRRLPWLVLIAWVTFRLIAGFAAPLGSFDDSLPLVAADLINRGRIPQVDFHTVYPPLLNYLIAVGFRFLGRTVLVARAWNAVLYLAVLWGVLRVLRARARGSAILCPIALWATLVVAAGIGSFLLAPAWAGYAVSFLAVLIWVAHAEKSRTGGNGSLLAAGLLSGIASLIRFNFAFYAVVVVVVDLTAEEILSSGVAPPSPGAARLWRLMRRLTWLAAPVIAINALFYLGVYGSHAAPVFLQTISAANAAIRHRFMVLTFDRWTLGFLLWPWTWFALRAVLATGFRSRGLWIAVAPGTALTLLIFTNRTHVAMANWAPAIGLMLVVALHIFLRRLSRVEFGMLLYFVCLCQYFLARADWSHTLPLFPVIAVMIGSLVSSFAGSDYTENPATTVAGTVICLLLGSAFWAVDADSGNGHRFETGLRLLRAGFLSSRVSDVDQLRYADAGNPWLSIYPIRTSIADEWNAVRFVRGMTTDGNPLFVGVQDHSRVFANDVRAYWLADRLPGSRYMELDAGVASREDVQRIIVADFERSRLNWAILEDTAGSGDATFLATLHSGSELLDTFFKTRFEEVARFGRFSVVRRRDSPALPQPEHP